MKRLLLIIALFLPLILLAQRNVTGKIIDAKTGEPIDITSIYTRSNSTISNELGEFVLTTNNDTLLISHLGYLPIKVAVTGEFLNIELKPRPFTLDAVIIRPDALLHGVYEKYFKIFKAYEDQNKEFPKATFYYRQTTFQDTINTEFIECFFNGTVATGVDNLTIKHGRYAKISDKLNFTNAYIFSQLSPITFFKLRSNPVLTPYVTPLCSRWSSVFNIELGSLIEANTSDEIRIYKFTPKKKQSVRLKTIIGGSLHIRTRDSTIVKFEGESKTLNLYAARGMKIVSQNFNLTITYKDFEPFPIVESAKMQIQLEFKSRKETSSLKINTIMYMTEHNVDTYDTEEHLIGSLVNKLEKHEYNPIFWRDNPIIKRTPIENKIIEDFNRLGYFGNFEL